MSSKIGDVMRHATSNTLTLKPGQLDLDALQRIHCGGVLIVDTTLERMS